MNVRKLKFVIFLFVGLFTVSSCNILKPNRAKQAEKLEKEQIKEAEKAYEQLKEDHINRQSEGARNRMEMTKRRSEYLNRSKKRLSFWQRIFGKRDKKRK